MVLLNQLIWGLLSEGNFCEDAGNGSEGRRGTALELRDLLAGGGIPQPDGVVECAGGDGHPIR